MPITRQHLVARSLAVSCALLLAAACSDTTAPGQVRSTFTIVPGGGVSPPPTPTVRATSASITVDGMLVTADPCFTVSGNARVSHDTLVVRTVGIDRNVACVQSLGMWHYVLTVNPRPVGVDAIRVEHDGGIGTAKVVLEQALP